MAAKRVCRPGEGPCAENTDAHASTRVDETWWEHRIALGEEEDVAVLRGCLEQPGDVLVAVSDDEVTQQRTA